MAFVEGVDGFFPGFLDLSHELAQIDGFFVGVGQGAVEGERSALGFLALQLSGFLID